MGFTMAKEFTITQKIMADNPRDGLNPSPNISGYNQASIQAQICELSRLQEFETLEDAADNFKKISELMTRLELLNHRKFMVESKENALRDDSISG
jgi:hypothetical protein